jgi:serine/threonine protein kinase
MQGNSSSHNSAPLADTGASNTLQDEAGCSCSSCSVQLAFKYAKPYDQLTKAAKAIYGSVDAYSASIQRCYAREWRVLDACSSCSNVLSGYAFGQLYGCTPGSHARPCMLMELSQLGNANKLLAGADSPSAGLSVSTSGEFGGMSSLQAQRIVLQVAHGLEAVHAVPAVYCNLKPANLLLFGDPDKPTFKLADFTTSILPQDACCRADSYAVTDGWAAPEAWSPNITSAMDIWTLGVLLLWLRHGGKALWCTSSQLSAQPPCAELPGMDLDPIEQDFATCCLCLQPSERWPVTRLLQEHHYLSKEYQGG